MPWLKTGDTSAHHPVVMAVREHPTADDRLLNEACGFATRCALMSAAHTTDYVVSRGTAIDLAGSKERAEALIEVCLWAGYFTDRKEIDGRTYYVLIQDPEFLHMRLRAEIQWERQRKRDNSNPELIVPVRWRDGDGCRHCGAVVNWQARTGGRAGTYQHLKPGEPATAETLVVACKSCNSAAGDNPGELPLLPVPDRPYYSDTTRTWFERACCSAGRRRRPGCLRHYQSQRSASYFIHGRCTSCATAQGAKT